jgi:heme/copper-type cytochrome/quinol oxidase subunit 1
LRESNTERRPLDRDRPLLGAQSGLSTVSKKPIFGYLGLAFALVAIAVIGSTVWAHDMFTTGISVDASPLRKAGSAAKLSSPSTKRQFP